MWKMPGMMNFAQSIVAPRKASLFVLVVMSSLALAVCAESATNVFDLGAGEAVYTTPRQVRYSFTINNTKGTPQNDAVFFSYAPIRQTSMQRCVRLEVSPPADLLTDRLGNQILRFNLATMPPFGVVIVTVKADLMLAEQATGVSRTTAVQLFSESESGIESDNPEIVKLARSLKAKKPIQTARQVSDWVSANLEDAGYIRNNRGALYALQSRKGDCTEYASLFAALCRADGIPARVMGGYLCNANAILNGAGYHNWAEFFDRKVWRVADPFLKSFDKNDKSYIGMNILNVGDADDPMLGAARYRVEGDGLKATMGN